MKCPKCAYERKPSDTTPSYECPSCGVIYAKYDPSIRAAAEAIAARKAARRAPKPPREPSKAVVFIGQMIDSKAGRFLLVTIGFVLAWLLLSFLFSPEFGTSVALIVLMLFLVKKGIEGSKAQQAQREAAMKNMPFHHCLSCGSDFQESSTKRGAKIFELSMWILITWPIALLYSIWRRLGSGAAKLQCPVCAATTVIPANSPAAVAHKKSLGLIDERK